MIQGAKDFDFLRGTWKVRNRFLVGRLRESNQWIEFDAKVKCRPMLDGLANIDEFVAVREGKRVIGMSLRIFDPATSQWTIYWSDNQLPGTLQPPVRGRFSAEGGEFLGTDQHPPGPGGKPVRVRYRWSETRTPKPRWEQAFSPDQGRTWETNWIMIFTRIAP